jgi:hypothetical protein
MFNYKFKIFMKKRLLLLTVSAFVGLTANSQTLIKTTRGFKNNEVKAKLNSNSVEKDLTGSIVCNTAFVAGTTMNLDFTYTPSTTTGEWGAILEFVFPTGIVPNSGTDPLMTTNDGQPGASIAINGQTVTWTSGDLTYGGIEGGAVIDFTVNVTVDANLSGDQSLAYTVTGDGWNNQAGSNITPTVVNGTLTIADNNVPFTDAKVIATSTNARYDDGSNNFYRVSNCELSNLPVAARIVNLGNTPLTNFSISFQLDNDSPVSEVVSATINPSDSLWYYFTATIPSITQDLHALRSYASASADVNLANDTSAYIYFSNSLPTNIETDNYTNAFESDYEKFSTYKTWSGAGAAFNLSSSTTHAGSGAALYFSPSVVSGYPEGVYSTYVFTTCLEVKAGSNYVIKYYRKANTSTAAPVNGETAILTGETFDLLALDTLRDFTPITANAQAEAWEKDSVIYVAPTDGVRYFAIAGRAETTGTAQVPTKIGNVRIDDVEVYLLSSAGINEVAGSVFTVFPNPANDVVSVSLNNVSGTIRLLSADGKVIESREVSSSVENFNVKSLNAGVYFIQVGQTTQKLMVK